MRSNNILILLIFEFVGHLAAVVRESSSIYLCFSSCLVPTDKGLDRGENWKKDEKEEGTRITIYTSNSRKRLFVSGYSTRLLFIYADAATRIMRLPIIIFHYTRSIERCTVVNVNNVNRFYLFIYISSLVKLLSKVTFRVEWSFLELWHFILFLLLYLFDILFRQIGHIYSNWQKSNFIKHDWYLNRQLFTLVIVCGS